MMIGERFRMQKEENGASVPQSAPFPFSSQ
jgi:hypothetical protein